MTDSYHTGFVAIVGAPNVGKSTLINSMLGQPWLAVSPIPQTTLREARMIISGDQGQMILVDTAGLLPFTGNFYRPILAASVKGALDADLVVRLVGQHADDDPFFARVDELLQKNGKPVLQVQTRADRSGVDPIPDVDYRVSGKTGAGVPELMQKMMDLLPPGPALFPLDDLSVHPMREFVEGWIREILFTRLRDELPHSTFVEIEEYQERDDGSLFVRAALGVERDSQKGILIGGGGSKIKQLGIAARKRIEECMGCTVHLKLFVKVRANWRKNQNFARQYGVNLPEEEVNRYCALVGL